MKWVRAYPNAPTCGPRSWVVDTHCQPFQHTNYDYRDLITLDDDILLLEWDIAASREDMRTFEEDAADNPGSVLVAPQLLYHIAETPVYAHRIVNMETGAERWIYDGETDKPGFRDDECDYFAFGMIYLPRDLIRQFLDTPAPDRGRSPFLLPEQGYIDDRFIDQTFSVWHRHTLGRRVRVDWDVRPIHLHW